jgi:hypothetical protein
MLYVALAILVYPLQKYFIDADGISYISIAQKYAAGNFKDGINGFWSPMISWIIAVLLFIIPNKIIAAKVAGVLIGASVLFSIKLFAEHFSFKKNSKILIYCIAVPLLICYCYYEVPVDFTLILFLLPYLYFVFHPSFFEQIKYPILAGVMGCLSYFAKQYAFPFFMLHFFILIGFRLINEKKLKSKFHFLIIGYVAFLITAAPWIFLISNKYQSGIIYGTTGKINFSQALNNEVRNINDRQGYFLKNPNPTAIDYTEDVFFIQGKYVSMMDSKETLNNEIALIKKSISDFFHQIIEMNLLIPFFILLAILILIRKKLLDDKLKKIISFSLITIFIYPSGYLLIHAEARFFWIINILVLFIGIKIFELVATKNELSMASKRIIAALIFILFLANPVMIFIDECYRLQYVTQIAERLKNEYHISGNIYAEGGDCADTQHVGLLLNSHLFIVNPRYYNLNNDLKTELLNNHVNYYFYWHWQANQSDTLKSFYNFEEITHGKIYGLQVFKIQ